MDRKRTKSPPYPFVLEALESAHPLTRPMFGCTAVYVGERIVLILREKPEPPEDQGVWLATSEEHHVSLSRDFPSMRSIALFGPKVTGWQVLPAASDDFEEAALKACRLILREDPRIGKVPQRKKPRKPARKSPVRKSR